VHSENSVIAQNAKNVRQQISDSCLRARLNSSTYPLRIAFDQLFEQLRLEKGSQEVTTES
jgi:hypothetical protein